MHDEYTSLLTPQQLGCFPLTDSKRDDRCGLPESSARCNETIANLDVLTDLAFRKFPFHYVTERRRVEER